jgi:curli biogenesis system outer membrane secretion channel CsgG
MIVDFTSITRHTKRQAKNGETQMKWLYIALAAGAAITVGACSSTQLGGGGSLVQGSAGETGSTDATKGLERCSEPLGTVTLDESNVPSGYYQSYWGNNVNSTIPMFRLLAAQSGCFALVERGKAFDLLENERRLSQGGQLQQGSNIGDGQLVAADYVLRPEIVVSDTDAGGLGGALGGLVGNSFGGIGNTISSLAGSVKFSDAQTLIYVVDVRTGLQKGIAEGSARTSDFGARIGFLGGLPGWGSLSGYTSTNQGKVVTASYLDAYNGLVRQLRASG